MARIVYQEQEHVIPDGSTRGEQLMQALKVPPNHDLVRVQETGNELIHRYDWVRPVDGDYFVDAPRFVYGEHNST